MQTFPPTTKVPCILMTTMMQGRIQKHVIGVAGNLAMTRTMTASDVYFVHKMYGCVR